MQDTGDVLGVSERTTRDQHWQLVTNIEASVFRVSQLREQRRVRGRGLDMSQLDVVESRLAEYRVPALTISQGGNGVVLGDECGDGLGL